MNLLFWIFLIIGMMCLLYYCVISIYAGIGSTFSWFWLIGGVVCILLGRVVRYMEIQEIRVPNFMIILIITALAMVGSAFAIIEIVLLSQAKRKAEQGMDYLIVLGAQVRGTTISKSLQKRLDTAITYLKNNPNTVAIVSGGKGSKEAITEAEAMYLYLRTKGISSTRILQEDKSTNTKENIHFSKAFLKDNATVAIVTNGFHIFRATSIARKQGITQVQGLAAPTDLLLSINYYVREAVGVMKDKVFGNL